VVIELMAATLRDAANRTFRISACRRSEIAFPNRVDDSAQRVLRSPNRPGKPG
jgi:hypothetical protein